ncbi:glucan 4-alpha-glucosidase [Botrytis cinerea]
MPSPEPEKDETAPAQPKSPGSPQKTSPARNAPNGAAIRKPGVKPRTPANAPIHKRPPSKKSEPTLLSDFLLGRPSASRQRRKSLDAVKAEMRESTVNRIQKPGGVHDRVKQWQKASAAAAIEEADDPESELDEIIVEVEEESVVGPSVVTEDNRLHARNQNTRPGRRKNRDPEDWAAEVRSKSAPRKRVISDDHWVMNKTKASPKKKDIKVTMRAIPKDFLQQTAANPKLESKIADWVKRTEAESGGMKRPNLLHEQASPHIQTSVGKTRAK